VENSTTQEVSWEQQQIEALEKIEELILISVHQFEISLKGYESELKKNSSFVPNKSVQIVQLFVKRLWVEYFHKVGKIEVAKNTIYALVSASEEVQHSYLSTSINITAAALSMIESNYDEANKYYNYAYETLLSLKKYDKILMILSQKALVENFLGNYNIALEILIEGIQFSKDHKVEQSIGYIYKTLGIVYANLDSYDHALTWQLEAKSQIESEGNNVGLASVLGELGNIYSFTKEYTIALEYYQQAFDLAHSIGDSLTELTILTNIGSTYRDINEIDKSFSYAYQNLDLSKRKENKRLESYALQLIGSLYLLQKEYAHAREFFTRSYHLRKELGYKRGEVLSLLELATTLRLMGEHQEAIRLLFLSLSLAESIETKRIKADIHIELMYCFQELGLWKEAHNHLLQHTILSELVYNERVASTIAKERIVHEVESSKKETVLLKQKNEELEAAYMQLNEINGLLEKQQKEIERQLHFSRKQNERLESLSKEKDEILAIAAHDLKNPLSIIALSSSKVGKFFEKMTNEQLLEEMKTIQTTSNRMSEILKNLLELHTLESGKYYRPLETVKVNEFINEIVFETIPYSKSKDIAIIVTPSKDTQTLLLKIDKFAFKSIIENLLTNAIKFSNNGSKVIIRCTLEKNNFSFPQATENFILEIQDQGQGFKKEEMSSLFQKFAKFSAKPTGGEHSTGLGLAIVKKYVEKMGASIVCRSTYGSGTTFSLKFPIQS
jgi:signal transduction histidine kinase